MTSMFGAVIGDSVMQQQVWKVRDDGICDVSCPLGNYTESLTDPHLCVRCVGSCPKGMNSRLQCATESVILTVTLDMFLNG